MLDRLNRALDVVEQAVATGGDVDVPAMARIVATSEHHLRRTFSVLAGMPLSEYVRRRRMSVAAADVVRGDARLLDVAVRHGYSSTEAFTRAFRAVHGVGAGEARRHRPPLVSQPRVAFQLTVEGSSTMEYRIVDKPAFRIVGRRTRVPIVHLGRNAAMEEFEENLELTVREQVANLSDQEPAGPVAVTDDIDGSRAEGTYFDYWHAAVTSRSAPPNLDELAVPAGTWLVLTASGPYPEALQYLWRDAYAEWFPANPWRTRPGPEILSATFDDDDHAEGELWLPIEADG